MQRTGRASIWKVEFGLEKYPSGRRGSPAKGVGCDKRREGSNPSFSAKNKTPIIGVLFLYLHMWRVTEVVITGRS